MACFLRVSGEYFDVDTACKTLKLNPKKIWRKGQPRYKSNPEKLNEWSGLNIEVSNAEFNEFDKQKNDCLEFIDNQSEILKRLSTYQGVELFLVDFGIEWRDVAVQSDYFSPELIGALAKVGLGLELSQYPPEE